MCYENIKKLNNHLEIKKVDDVAFKAYGNVIIDYDFSELLSYMSANTSIPADGNVYVASVEEMEATGLFEKLHQDFYGQMPIQIGYCNGKNSSLNGLEYHKGSEINVAVTDLVLLLGRVQDIENNTYASNNVEAFYVPKGCAVELYATTLHFAPCKVEDIGFKCIVILPRGTNQLLEDKASISNEAKLLFAKNKWLLAHPLRKQLIDKGAYGGIVGDNIEVESMGI